MTHGMKACLGSLTKPVERLLVLANLFKIGIIARLASISTNTPHASSSQNQSGTSKATNALI